MSQSVWQEKHTYWLKVLMSAGIPLMKATSFLFEATRTPTCHDFFHFGGKSALMIPRGYLDMQKPTIDYHFKNCAE